MAQDPVSRGRAHAQLLARAGAAPVDVLTHLLQLVREHGDDAGLLSDIAALLFACGQEEDALAYAIRANQVDPTDEDARANLAAILATGSAAGHELLGPPPSPAQVADPALAPHAVAHGGLLVPDDGLALQRVAVIGGESCGTRLMSTLLAKAGCEVLHRSFPYEGSHLRHWPDEPVREYGPDAFVVMTRDWWAAAPSQVRAGHVADLDTAFANLQEATSRIAALVRGRHWRAVGYESLVQRPQVVFDNLCEWLGVARVEVGEIFDGNERYLDAERVAATP